VIAHGVLLSFFRREEVRLGLFRSPTPQAFPMPQQSSTPHISEIFGTPKAVGSVLGVSLTVMAQLGGRRHGEGGGMA
jgi:hypothetical protein